MTNSLQDWLQPALLPEATPAVDPRRKDKKIQPQRSRRKSTPANHQPSPRLLALSAKGAIAEGTKDGIAPVVPTSLKARPNDAPEGWVDPSDPAFRAIKNCRLCGWPIRHGGLDHSLCSGDCGWVVDLTWQQQQAELKQRKRSHRQEAQAATHADGLNGCDPSEEAIDLFRYDIDSTSEAVGGAS